MSAVISCDGKYRYLLTRQWDKLSEGYHIRRVLWVMLNPSTADAALDDRTISRCIAFSKAWGFDGMEVVNAYAYRSTDPYAMLALQEPEAVGPDNDYHIDRAAIRCDRMVCAWGTHVSPAREERMLELLRNHGRIWCLKRTKDGHPGHPLYLSGSLIPVEF